jgi:hypothetical protein
MFKLLGVAIAIYTLYAVMRGEVHAKDDQGRIVSRVKAPEYFDGRGDLPALAIALSPCSETGEGRSARRRPRSIRR